MIINSVNIINLARRTDLAIAQRAVWTAMGASPEQIVFHEAIDGSVFSDRQGIIEAGIADGFPFFREVDDENAWFGCGELACFLSISKLLQHIADGVEDQVYLYVLADRFSKKRLPYLEQLFDRLPDFMLFQFKGIVPHWSDLDREAIKSSYPENYVPSDDIVPENTIEIANTKMGDGVLAMTPAGARWMFELAEKYSERFFLTPYEVMLWHEGDDRIYTPGVYSTPCAEYDFSDESSLWEGEFPHPLAGWHASDIGEANRISETGAYRNYNEALDQKWFETEA